jgi:hypothetical protein
MSTRAPAATAFLHHGFEIDGGGFVDYRPDRVASSKGSPQTYSAVLATRRRVNSGAMPSWTRMRLTAVQRWPELRKLPSAAR